MDSQQQQDPSADTAESAQVPASDQTVQAVAAAQPTATHTAGPTDVSPAAPIAAPTVQDDVAVRVPDFAALQDTGQRAAAVPLDRFYDVNVTVWAELGRTAMPIAELLQLGEGTVLKLGRSISEPIDLVAQGVLLARGEVVVVDDCFAVRIKEIESSEKT